jgi:hypothetical protein
MTNCLALGADGFVGNRVVGARTKAGHQMVVDEFDGPDRYDTYSEGWRRMS